MKDAAEAATQGMQDDDAQTCVRIQGVCGGREDSCNRLFISSGARPEKICITAAFRRIPNT